MITETMSPRITCVICTYRRPDVIAGAIQSVVTQTLPPDAYDIIVVDNDSQDQTATIVQQFLDAGVPNLRYYVEPQRGLSHSRNCGLYHARSDIIAFLDDDAEADSGWLASLCDVYDQDPDIWAVGGAVDPIWSCPPPAWLTPNLWRSLSLLDWGAEVRKLQWPERIIGTNCSFRRVVFTDIGLFDVNLGRQGSALLSSEDTEIQQRIHRLGKYVYYSPYARVAHHVPQTRLTLSYFWKRFYGQGRTLALLAAQQNSRRVMIGQALFRGASLPTRRIGREIARRGRTRHIMLFNIAGDLGFIAQTVLLLRQQPSLGTTSASLLIDRVQEQERIDQRDN
jgi:glycosyltransferase involved in cell wall biosynthesis